MMDGHTLPARAETNEHAASAMREALSRVKRCRDATASLDGCVALDAILDALKALDRGQNEILPAMPPHLERALEEVADMLTDIAADVAGYYAKLDAEPGYDAFADARREERRGVA